MEILIDAGMFRSRGPAAPQPPLTGKGWFQSLCSATRDATSLPDIEVRELGHRKSTSGCGMIQVGKGHAAGKKAAAWEAARNVS
jgi:hypothetical protein